MPDSVGLPVYFLVHAPKAAGTTIEKHLRASMPRERLWCPEPPTIWALLRGHRRQPEQRADLAEVRALTGHWIGRSLERHFPGRPIRRTLLLRDPIGFQLSYYNHRMMFALSMGRRVCGFDQHLRTQPRDALALFLLWYWLEVPVIRLLATSDAQRYALLNEELSRFWFVGSYQYCDELIAAIAPDLDVPPAARRTNTTPGWQRRVDWRPLQEDELPDATRQEILSRNPMHVALWETWRDARFAGAGVHPKPLPAAHRSSLGWRELLRAGLTDRLIWMREFEARRPWEEAARASRAGDWRRAVSLYRKALDQAPGFPDVWVQYGHALCEAGDIAAAETAYRRALELDDGLAAAALSLGGVLQQQGRTEEARDAFRRFERLDPAALGRMAEGLVAAGWEPEAVAAHWRALTGDAQADAPA